METRVLNLPSGLAITICKPSGLDQILFLGGLRRVSQFAGETNDTIADAIRAQQTPEDIEAAMIAVAKRAARVCVHPQFSIERNPPMGMRSLHELALPDYLALLDGVQKFSDEAEAEVRPLSETATSS